MLLMLYSLVLTVVGIARKSRSVLRRRKLRHLLRVWGIRDGDAVVVVCSELDDAEQRQFVEEREFIYSLKYGDVDAYFELVATLLRLYPRIRLRVMSAGEAQGGRVDLAAHLILIGGPDYNAVTAWVLGEIETRFRYRSPDMAEQSESHPDEIALFDSVKQVERCSTTSDRDYGYLERFPNPNNAKNNIVVVGGCHTLGVTGAVKAFSLADSEQGEVPAAVLGNARVVGKAIRRAEAFAVLVEARRMGQTVATPVVRDADVTISARA